MRFFLSQDVPAAPGLRCSRRRAEDAELEDAAAEAQLAALGSARFSSSGDFRDFNTSQLIKFLALHGGQGSWDRALFVCDVLSR